MPNCATRMARTHAIVVYTTTTTTQQFQYEILICIILSSSIALAFCVHYNVSTLSLLPTRK